MELDEGCGGAPAGLPPGVRLTLSRAGSPPKAFGGGCACCPASADASPSCGLCHDDGADVAAEEAAAAGGGHAEGVRIRYIHIIAR